MAPASLAGEALATATRRIGRGKGGVLVRTSTSNLPKLSYECVQGQVLVLCTPYLLLKCCSEASAFFEERGTCHRNHVSATRFSRDFFDASIDSCQCV